MIMKQTTLKRLACFAALAVMTGGLAGCSQAEELKLSISSEDVSEDYSMVEADYADVVLEESISCLYSQINEESLAFNIEKRELTHIYVADGDTVKAGQLVAKLNVDDLEKKLRDNDDLIAQDELLIEETNKLIDYYEGLLKGSLGLKRREEIEFKVIDSLDLEEGSYVALETTPDDPVAYLNSDGSLIILKTIVEDGEEILATIDDDEEFDKVSEIFMSRLSDLYDFDTDEDE